METVVPTLPLWIHSPAFSTVLCAPGSWPFGTASVRLSRPLALVRFGQWRHRRERRWQHLCPLGSSLLARGWATFLYKGPPVEGASPAASPTAMFSKVLLAMRLCLCACPHFVSGLFIRLSPIPPCLSGDWTQYP